MISLSINYGLIEMLGKLQGICSTYSTEEVGEGKRLSWDNKI